METIKITKIVEEIVGYKAIDGTEFKSKEECEKYDRTAKAVIKSRFKKLVIKEMEGIDISDSGSKFLMASIDEDWYYALVEIKNENDLKAAQMYYEITCRNCKQHGFNESMIGKKVVVSIGSGIYPKPTEGEQCAYDNCYVFGTIEDQVKKYEEAIRELEK